MEVYPCQNKKADKRTLSSKANAEKARLAKLEKFRLQKEADAKKFENIQPTEAEEDSEEEEVIYITRKKQPKVVEKIKQEEQQQKVEPIDKPVQIDHEKEEMKKQLEQYKKEQEEKAQMKKELEELKQNKLKQDEELNKKSRKEDMLKSIQHKILNF